VDELRANWEERAANRGTPLSKVLFRGLSEQANAAIHVWHRWVIGRVFAPALSKGGKILDLGCGYGRLARALVHERSDLSLLGQDMVLAFCRQFSTDVGACVCADAISIPFSNDSFDGAMAVTCLMYAPRESVSKALAELHRVVRPGGPLLLLDPGLELQRTIARLRVSRHGSPTGGQGFQRGEYIDFVRRAGFEVRSQGGNRLLSAALLLPGVAGSASPVVHRILRRCAIGDCRASGYSRLALHRWVFAVRREAQA
jgi:SAM-dependent methyltransferase